MGLAAIGVLVATAAAHRDPPSLDRLASRVERAQVLPEETRQILRSVTQRPALGAKANGIDDRQSATAARIERAMQSKPAVTTHY